ncbi:hypothetical protein J6590_013063 [Homalodisca vitripennis]|nr:hypothetical protein J6590_013063 [Homalodisca vitripennis]
MLKWTVHKTAGGGSGVGPCYSIRRAAAKLSKHRPRRSADKENQENEHRPSPRKRDSIYMCLDTLPAALRDVSNYQSLPRTPENQGKVQDRLSGSQPRSCRKKSPCSSCSPHRTEVFRDKSDNPPCLKRSRSAIRLRQTPAYLLNRNSTEVFNEEPYSKHEFCSPARKKQPCTDLRHQDIDLDFNQTFSVLSENSSTDFAQIDYSPCPLKATQSLVALRQRMTETFPLLSQGISLDNPLYYALNQSPSPSPVDLVNKEIPTTRKKDASETPTRTKDFISVFAQHVATGLNESDEIKMSPKQDSVTSQEQVQDCGIPRERLKTCDVSPLARRLAWLRLNTAEKNRCLNKTSNSKDGSVIFQPDNDVYSDTCGGKGFMESKTLNSFVSDKLERNCIVNNTKTTQQFDVNYDKIECNRKVKQFVNNIVMDSSVIHILNTNHERQKRKGAAEIGSVSRSHDDVNNLVINEIKMDTECTETNTNTRNELTTALKRRGVIFNEQTFLLNTPPTSDSDERRTKTSSCCTSIDLDEPSTLKRQKVIRRRIPRVNNDSLAMSKRLPRRHPISYLTLPKGLPSPLDGNVENSLQDTPKRSRSVSHLGLDSSKKVTFGSLYDIEYSDSGENNSPSFLGLTLPKGIPSPPSPDDEEIPGVRPLECPISNAGNKRKCESGTNASECSEETWDSHGQRYLKTPKLAEDAFDDVSFAESSRMKSPTLSKNNDEEDNDDDFSSLASSTVTSSSPLRQSRSRRCLSFASPSKRTRSWKRIMGRATRQALPSQLLLHHRHNVACDGTNTCFLRSGPCRTRKRIVNTKANRGR